MLGIYMKLQNHSKSLKTKQVKKPAEVQKLWKKRYTDLFDENMTI